MAPRYGKKINGLLVRFVRCAKTRTISINAINLFRKLVLSKFCRHCRKHRTQETNKLDYWISMQCITYLFYDSCVFAAPSSGQRWKESCSSDPTSTGKYNCTNAIASPTQNYSSIPINSAAFHFSILIWLTKLEDAFGRDIRPG